MQDAYKDIWHEDGHGSINAHNENCPSTEKYSPTNILIVMLEYFNII